MKQVNNYSVAAVEESAKRKGKQEMGQGFPFESAIREGPSEEVTSGEGALGGADGRAVKPKRQQVQRLRGRNGPECLRP